MITQPPNNKNALTLNKNVQDDKETSLRRCEEISKLIESKIQQEIINGQVKVRKKPLHIQSNNDLNPLIQNPERSIRDKISSLSTDLQMLHKQMAMQKERQRERQEHKKREASLLIQRLKREKEEHRNKLRFNQMSSRLKSSVLSEDVLKLMRQRRESLVLQKKKDMQLRIYKIMNRRVQREEDQNKNQINYWTKIKQIQDKKRHQSTKLLPSIQKANEEPQFGINLLQRKNSNFSVKRSLSKQDLTIEYHDVVKKFLSRAKAKQSETKSQQSPNYKSRVMPSQVISQKNQSLIPNSKVSVVKNQNVERIVTSILQDKRKILGNEYLKQSLLKVDRAKSPRASTIMDYSFAEQSLQLRGNPAIFNKNDKVSYLEERRQKILQSFRNNKLEKSMTIQMLGPVQLRLDRINPEGTQKRLKQKLQLFEEAQKKIEKDQKYKVVTQFEQNLRRI